MQKWHATLGGSLNLSPEDVKNIQLDIGSQGDWCAATPEAVVEDEEDEEEKDEKKSKAPTVAEIIL